jgi:hypothetical protein
MRKVLLGLAISALCVGGVQAAVDPDQMGDAKAISTILQMEEAGRPAAEIVNALVSDGRRVADTVALVAGVARTDVIRSTGTLFGMCLAPDNGELAHEVGAAAQRAAGDNDAVAATVSQFTVDKCRQFYPFLRPPGGFGVEPKGPGIDPIPPISPAN